MHRHNWGLFISQETQITSKMLSALMIWLIFLFHYVPLYNGGHFEQINLRSQLIRCLTEVIKITQKSLLSLFEQAIGEEKKW